MFFECVHRPEVVVPVPREQVAVDQPLERLDHQFLPLAHVVEDFLPEYEVSAVDEQTRVPDVFELVHETVLFEIDNVKRLGRAAAHECCDLARVNECLDHGGKMGVGQAVRIVREEHLLPREVLFHLKQPLPDVGLKACLHKRDLPALNIAPHEQPEVLPPVCHRKIIGDVLVIVEKEVFDLLGLVSQAQNELRVPEVGVIFHNVPEDRLGSDRNQRLRQVVGIVPQAGAKSSAEENDFH